MNNIAINDNIWFLEPGTCGLVLSYFHKIIYDRQLDNNKRLDLIDEFFEKTIRKKNLQYKITSLAKYFDYWKRTRNASLLMFLETFNLISHVGHTWFNCKVCLTNPLIGILLSRPIKKNSNEFKVQRQRLLDSANPPVNQPANQRKSSKKDSEQILLGIDADFRIEHKGKGLIECLPKSYLKGAIPNEGQIAKNIKKNREKHARLMHNQALWPWN